MPIRRVVASLILKDGWIVQSLGFERYLPVSRAEVAVDYLNSWDIDEIVLLDISARGNGTHISGDLVERVSTKCFVPLAVGGGIKDINAIAEVIRRGAEKAVINTHVFDDPGFVEQAADVFGSQCIVISIDAKPGVSGGYEVFADGGARATGRDPADLAHEMQERGAGEIFLNAIHRDGSKQGYDAELIQRVASRVHIPVIVCGGVGTSEHIADGMKGTSADAFAAGNFFHFTEHSVTHTKAFIGAHGSPTRHGVDINYDHVDADQMARPRKNARPFRQDEDLLTDTRGAE